MEITVKQKYTPDEYERRNLGNIDKEVYLVEIKYDEEIEKTLCNNDEDLLYFIRTVRKICSRKNIQLIVSYRAISRLYKLNDGSIPLDELLNTCLFKNVTTKELQYIIDDYPKDDIYKTAMCALTLSE